MSDREAFTPFEEAFFREGLEMDKQAERFEDLDHDVRPRSLLRRLLSRRAAQQ